MVMQLSAFAAFWNTPGGIAVWAIVDACVLVLILALNYRWLGKRLLDIIFSIAFLAVFFAFFLIFLLADCIYARKSGAYPSLFERIEICGRKGKPVRVYLFRCERDTRGADGLLLPVRARTTLIGRLCRACGMRWYPALIGVLAGRLSFVGPRPLTPAEAAALPEEARVRFAVRPGLVSSLARYGGEGLTYPDMFEEDAEYVSSYGMMHDVVFFLSAVASRCRGEGNKLGVCGQMSYIDWLLREGKITPAAAAALQAEEQERLRRREQAARDRENFRPRMG